MRNFACLRKVAANGGEVIVRDRGGRAFIFRATDEHHATLAEQLHDLRGSLATGVRVKSLKGFGRNRA
ncbi:MAG: hypothetical protein HZA93_29020 [Verrucomicrobia bacterium]|nr:hypothetical protein [Verrucomicrobiota bacterium]